MPTVASGKLTWATPKQGLHGFEPTNRSGHTLNVLPREHGNAVLMFGGRELNGEPTNELYRLDVGNCRSPHRGTWMWSMQPTAASRDPPAPAREGHCATIFRNYFVVFGGLGRDGLLNDVYALNLDTLVWFRPETSGALPIRRHRHSGCTFSRNLVVFGGYSEYGDSENDVAVLDMAEWAWSSPQTSGEAPCPRQAHSATRFGARMVVYGGYSLPEDGPDAGALRFLRDVHVLDTERWVWSAPKMGSAVPNALARCGHAAARVEESLVVCGGRGAGESGAVDVWMLDTDTWVWAKAAPVPEVPAAVGPEVSEHAMCLFGAPYSGDVPVNSEDLSLPKLIVWGGDMGPAARTVAFVLELPDVEFGPNAREVFLPELEAVGCAVARRLQVERARNWQMVDVESAFPRNSSLVQWRFWALEPGTVRLQVYRACPQEGAAGHMQHPFQLIGENVVTATAEGYQVGMRIDNAAAAGAGWPHKLQAGERADPHGQSGTPSGVVTFDAGPQTAPAADPDVAHAGHHIRFTAADYPEIGGVLDFASGGQKDALGNAVHTFRTYSLCAMITPAADQAEQAAAELPPAEREAGLRYVIADPTLSDVPRRAMEEELERRLLEAPASTSPGKGTRRKGGASPSKSAVLTPARGTGGGVPGSGSLAGTERVDSTRRRGGGKETGRDGGKGQRPGETGTVKLKATEGARVPLKTPVMDGRRMPDGERMPKEVAMRESGRLAGTAASPTRPPAPVFADDEGEAEVSRE